MAPGVDMGYVSVIGEFNVMNLFQISLFQDIFKPIFMILGLGDQYV